MAEVDKQAIRSKMLELLQKGQVRKIEPERITDQAKLSADLGLDSIDLVEYVWELEQAFNIQINDQALDKIVTVKDAVDSVAALVAAKEGQA